MQTFPCGEWEGTQAILLRWLLSDFITRKINTALLSIFASRVICKLGNKMQSSVFTFSLFTKETIKAVFWGTVGLTALFLREYWWLLSHDYRYGEKC